ncbi:MAG: hypothetical protein ABI700_21130 [Chloroflexota bacterium]
MAGRGESVCEVKEIQMQQMGEGFRRILNGILILISIIFIAIFVVIDIIRGALDHTFHTKLLKPKITVEEVENLIKANLAIGTSSEEIFDFLKAHELGYSDKLLDYNDSYEENARINQEVPAQHDLIKKLIVAWKHNVGQHLLVTTDIRIIIYLDDKNSLVEYAVKSFGTGL